MKSGIQIGIGHMLQSNCFEDAVDIWHTSGLIKSLLEKISKSDLLKHSKFQADIGMTDYVSLIPLHEFLGMDLDMYNVFISNTKKFYSLSFFLKRLHINKILKQNLSKHHIEICSIRKLIHRILILITFESNKDIITLMHLCNLQISMIESIIK